MWRSKWFQADPSAPQERQLSPALHQKDLEQRRVWNRRIRRFVRQIQWIICPRLLHRLSLQWVSALIILVSCILDFKFCCSKVPRSWDIKADACVCYDDSVAKEEDAKIPEKLERCCPDTLQGESKRHNISPIFTHSTVDPPQTQTQFMSLLTLVYWQFDFKVRPLNA